MIYSSSVDLIKDVIKPTPKQREFMRAVNHHRYTLYGGAAGGGKSYILRWELVYLLLRMYKHTKQKGIRVGLFCESYPALKDRQISKIRMEFPEWLGSYKESTCEFTLTDALGAGVICFRNLDNPAKYLSSEFAVIAIDELTLNDKSVFDFLRMRLRWVGITDTKFIAGTNPGGKGHGWVKSFFIDRTFTPEMQKEADSVAFVQAKVTDNPHLPSSYIDSLDTLPDKLRKAYKDGDWDIFEGQVFEEWRHDLHVCEPFAVPQDWPRYRSMDWGYTKPYAVYEYAVDYDDTVYVIGEWYGTKPGTVNTGTQETARDVARKISHLGSIPGVADPAIWQRTGHDGPTIAEIFEVEGVPWDRADNDRMAGLMQVHMRLKERKLKVFSSCTHLIRTLPALTYDKTHVEDVDTSQEDHAYDSLRYFLMSRPLKAENTIRRPMDGYKAVDEPDDEVTAWSI